MANVKSDGKILLTMFVGVIIALTLVSPIADNIFNSTNTLTYLNATFTMPTTANTSTTITGRELITGLAITNATVPNSTDLIGPAKFIILRTGNVSGGYRVELFMNDTAVAKGYAGRSVNVSYSFKPEGYTDSSGTQGIMRVILIVVALAVLVYSIVVFMQSDRVKEFMRK